jgi:hypothetical protein
MAASGRTAPKRLRILALWIYRDEIKNVGSAEVWSVHASQPVGGPLHKHEGFLEVDEDPVILEEGENKRVIPKSEIRDLQVSYDKNFRQFRDSRGMLPPMHFSFGDDEVYIFTLGSRFGYWQGKNTALSDAIGGQQMVN